MSVSYAKNYEANTIYQDEKARANVEGFEAEAAVYPGNLVAKGTAVGQIQAAIAGGGLTVPLGFVGDNEQGIVIATGLPIDPVASAFPAATIGVPVIRKGKVLAKASTAAGITEGDFVMVAAAGTGAGTVVTWTTGNIQAGQAITSCAASGYLVVDVNLGGS
jgi:hypothetical protein